MGKRKYEKECQEEAKKRKNEDDTVTDTLELPQNEKNKENSGTATSNKHIFDIKHFRKELAARQGQTMALTQFLQVCLNPDCEVDFMLEYLKVGGNSHEILRQISQDNKKNLTLATPTFHLFHLIILKVQTSLPHMITITEEACRYFLNTFVPTVEIMISENSGPRHRKIILKLLTSMVTLNSDLGIEVLNQIPLTPKNLQYITEKANYKEKDNVRTAFVHFITSFLVDGHLPLIKALLEKQGLLSLVIPGLVYDEPEAVLMFLNILKRNVIDNSLISKTLKLKTFSQQVLHNLFKVFLWKGPPELSNDTKKEYFDEIMNLLSDIVLTLYTSHKLGLYFIDNTLGVSDANKNQNLYKSLLTLKRPWENKYQCDALLEIVLKCPDLHRAIINIIEQSFQPQHSPIWEKTVMFFEKLLDKLRPEYLTLKLSKLNSIQTTNFIRFVTLPVPILKIIQANIGKDPTISLYCVRALVKMLQSLKRFMRILELEDENIKIDELKTRLENFLPKHLPQANIIVSLLDDVIGSSITTENSQDYTLTKISDADGLLALIDLLLLVNYVHPSYFESVESLIDMKKILDYSKTLTEGQISLLKFKIVSLWLMFDNSVLTLQNPVFKDLFLMMLTVFTSEDDNTWQEAKDTMHTFLKNTEIFEADEDEINLILYTLRIAKINNISLIAEIFEHILTNIEDLSEYIRNQVVNFEISDENNKSDLDKLFNDLMNKKNVENSMFIENKIPSPFLVGCVQYLQNNKDAKKDLKQFLGLYVSNLLHSNYSPELIEILIGDLKLDVRKYVADWLVKPVPLSEATSNDNTLIKISNVLIEQKKIALDDIFPILTPEKNVLDVERKAISSSDLFVWAKYLFFCVVRLTVMDKFEEYHQVNILKYLEVIMNLGKKFHMIDVCRNIILSFLKNSHVIEIFKPVNLQKNNSSLIATELILNVIERNSDIVTYVNRKHVVLKSYQEKNCKEILKAFIKMKKRKNVDSAHTVKVMKIIGTSKEGDAQIFDHIFETEISFCIKDDKEPSLVLDLLGVLLEKYSLLSLELHQDTLQKALKLYTNLLTNQELTLNLTKLELSLIQYFENKPHYITQVNEDDFKKFFYTNTTRKTMSQLASLFLQYNKKLCGIYREEICRPEILRLRELTLPLGNVMIVHDDFSYEHKELLQKIYEEYKSNIHKYLEKPHKIGHVYISSWKLIRKLIYECMSIQECQKIFSKSYKFEIAETGHLSLIQAAFLKICVLNERYQKEYFVNYFISMLHLASNALKDNKNDDTVYIVISNINTVINLSKVIKDFDIENKQDFQKITESGVWHSFCKIILKDALKIRTTNEDNTLGPKKMSVLTALVKLFYLKDHSDIVNLFDMVTSHSEFLNVMLSYHSPDIKFQLLKFIFTLISINKSIMKSQQIPVYLSAYRATRSPCDRLILTILQFYENNNMPVNEYKPYVFGDSAANFYAVRKSRSSTLWGHPSPNQVINLFDREIIETTIRNFPVDQKLDYDFVSFENLKVKKHILNNRNKRKIKDIEAAVNDLLLKDAYVDVLNEIKEIDVTTLSSVEKVENIYDPAFLYPLLSHILSPGSVASCFKLLRSGLLSVAVMGLSSHCNLMRAAAYHVLHRFCLLLETETRHKNDKLLLTDFITTLKQSLSTAINAPTNGELADLKNPRLPAIGALYLARAVMVSTYPSEPLYKPVNNFLIAKQFVDLTVVPDFLSLFHDSELETTERRIWILDIIKDGTKTMTDVNVVFKTMCLKMIMDFYTTVLCDKKSKVHILNALNSVLSVPRGFEILVEGYGFLSWMHFVVCESNKDIYIQKAIIDLLRNMICSLNINVFVKNCAKNNNKLEYLAEFKVKSDEEFEILNLVCEMLPNADCLEDELVEYVKLFNLITKRSIKFLTKRQIVNIVAKCSSSLKHSESATLLNQAVNYNNASMLCSKIIVNESANNKLCEELKTFVNTYIT